MPNVIRYSDTTTSLPSLKLNNFYIGTGGNPIGYGPSQSTGFFNGPEVPSSGYIIYTNDDTYGINAIACNSKEIVVRELKKIYPEALSNIYDLQEYYRFPVAVQYAHARDNILVVNKDYPNVPLQGLVCNVDPTYTMSYPRTGSTAYDISGTGNDGTLTDVGWGAELDGCFILNGTSSFINLGTSESLEFDGDDFSISFWFRLDNSPTEGSPVLLSKGTSGSTGLMVSIEDSVIAAYIDNSSGNPDLKSTTQIKDNDWHNVVLIRKGDVFQLVVDTFEESTDTLTGRTISTKDNMLIGKYGDDTKYFDGKIGAVQIYNRGLYAKIAPPTTNLTNYFDNGTDPNGDPIPESIVDWDTRNVTTMGGTFKDASDFNLDISGWDTSNVTYMGGMLRSASNFNQPIGSWDVSNVTNMDKMLLGVTSFNQPLSGWNVGNVTNFDSIFQGTIFNQDIGNWDVSSATTFRQMFRSTPFDKNINSWNTSNVSNMSYVFAETQDFNQPLNSWNTSAATDMQYMFYDTGSFNQDIGNWDVSNVTNMQLMFYGSDVFNNGGSPSISAWTTTSVTNMNNMFRNASLFNQPIGNWDVSNVTDVSNMFRDTSFNQDIGNWNTSSVTNMNGLFENNGSFNQDISSWDMSNVTTAYSMFRNATSFNQDISNWDVSSLGTMKWFFDGTNSFNQDISGWNVSAVTNMEYTFRYTNSFNQDISGWDVSNVTSMLEMFKNADSFNQNLSGWTISNVANMSNMFTSSNMSTENYSNTLIGWAAQEPNIQQDVSLGAIGISYNASAQDAVDLLTGTYGWTITDSTP